jgi:hypothetical protein
VPRSRSSRLALGLLAGVVALLAAFVAIGASVEPAVAGPNECADLIDNDDDALIDQADPGCRGAKDFGEADGRQPDPNPTVTPTETPTATPSATPTVTPTATPTPAPKPACSDGRDNDNDKKVDLADAGCARASDNDEYNAPAQCEDGKDNDKDSKTDLKDPGCSSPSDNDERNASPAPVAPTGSPAPTAPPPAGQTFGFSDTSTPPRRAKGLLAPFPVVRIAGRVYRTRVLIRLLTVKAPKGATIAISCRGRGCGRRAQRLKASSASASRRVHRYERTLRAGAMLEIRVYKAGMIGKYTRFTVRKARLPGRSDRCLMLNRRTPRSCPGD